MKKVLVTGGAGFIGSHLCEKLLNLDHEVICVDNFYTGQKKNISHLVDNKYFEVIRHDVCFPLYIEVDEILKTCYSKINDNYTILRMLKPYKSKLRIAYLGSMHVSRIVNFFFKQCDNMQVIDHFEGTEKCLHSEIAEKMLNNEEIDFLNEEYVRSI